MLNRMEFYDLGEGMKSIGIDISDLIGKADKFITCINSVNYNQNTFNKIKMIREAELLARDILQFVVVNVNPDLNRLIELDQKENDSHKNLIICIGLIQNKIEELKKNLIDKMSNKETYDANKITNKLNLDFYSSYLENLVGDLILKTFQYSFFKYIITKEPYTDSENYMKNIIKKFDSIKTVARIKKDRNLFWYLVFSYLFRSSQIIGFMPESQIKISKPIEIKDLRKLVRMEIESEKIKKEEKPQTPESQSPKKEEVLPEKPTEEMEETEDEESPTDIDEFEEDEDEIN